MMTNRMKILTCAACLCGIGTLTAATYVWTNATKDGTWSTAGNWTVDGATATAAPTGGDTALFRVAATITTPIDLGDDPEKTLTIQVESDTPGTARTVKLGGVISGRGGLCASPRKTTLSGKTALDILNLTGVQSTFTGPFTLTGATGHFQFATVANYGTPSSLGCGTAGQVIVVPHTVTLTVTGTSATDRAFDFTDFTSTSFNSSGHLTMNGPFQGRFRMRSSGQFTINSWLPESTVIWRTDGGTSRFHNPTNAFTDTPSVAAGLMQFNIVSNRGVACSAGVGTAFSLGQGNLTWAQLAFNGLGTGDSVTDRDLNVTFASQAGASESSLQNAYKALLSATAGRTLTWNGAIHIDNEKSALKPVFHLGGAGDGVFTQPFTGQAGGKKLELHKRDKGTWTLTADNVYTNATLVEAGRLDVNGSLDALSAVTVSASATLGGTGTVHGAVSVAQNGILAPGTAAVPGTLTVGGTLATTGAATLRILADPARGVCSRVDAQALALADVMTVEIATLSEESLPAGTYTLLTYTTLNEDAFQLADPTLGSLAAADGRLVLTAGLKTLVWKGDAAHNMWDYTTANWEGGALFADGSVVSFTEAGVASVPVELAADVRPNQITVSGAGDYVFTGAGRIRGESVKVVKSGAGALTFANTNDFRGLVTQPRGR